MLGFGYVIKITKVLIRSCNTLQLLTDNPIEITDKRIVILYTLIKYTPLGMTSNMFSDNRTKSLYTKHSHSQGI